MKLKFCCITEMLWHFCNGLTVHFVVYFNEGINIRGKYNMVKTEKG